MGRAPAKALKNPYRATDNRVMARVRTAGFIGGLSGTTGGAVFVARRDGSVLVRERPTFSNTPTTAQTDCKEAMAKASAAFRALDPEEARAWKAFARILAKQRAASGRSGTVSAQNIFVGLAFKLYQMDPAAVPPRTPPQEDFTGDGVVVSAAADGAEIVFQALSPNSPNVATELLVQELRTAATDPALRGYRNAAFVQFAPGSLSAAVPSAPGWHATAVRFVNRTTGQTSAVVELAVVRVD